MRPSWLIILFLSCLYSAHAQQGKRPNIIYIMADDMGYADLSCYGRKDYKTPNLDNLCSQGMKFINAYSAAPVCTPTRTAFMTGRYAARTPIGLLEPWVPKARDSAFGLSAQYPSLPLLLKRVGYETALIGKWHLGGSAEHSPLNNGFDYFYGIKTGAADYISHKGDGGRDDFYENENRIKDEGYLTELLTSRAISFLNKQHSSPFFLSLQFTAPHWPWQGPGDKAYPDTMKMSAGGSPAIYAAMMKSLDDEIGKIMNVVAERGLEKNTIIIFTSDNGGEKYSDMGVYKGKKMSLWEGGIRVPAFVKWKGVIEENSVNKQVVTTMDWTATILSLASAKPDPGFPLDGKDLRPVLTGKHKNIDRELYWRITQRNQQKAMRDGKWKWLQDEKGNDYLFDIEKDPSESTNVKEEFQDVYQRLKKKYAEWEKSVLTPVTL